MGSVLTVIQRNETPPSLSGMVKALDEECRRCAPITPFECLKGCRVYRLKNELIHLRQTMADPNYMKELFNVLKNTPRIHILQTIAKGHYTVNQLQQELKTVGYRLSQETITSEYLRPLMAVGLATEARDQYYTTSFGNRVAEQIGCLIEFAHKLPAHSECHEETLLQSMIGDVKTFCGVEEIISPRIVSRILKRLRRIGLVNTAVRRDYIFFFKSKRDPNKETFTPTERKVYDALHLDEGTSAGCLAQTTGVSKRAVYKFLRGMRGKKLIYERRTPKTYILTLKGEQLACVFSTLQQVVEDTWASTEQVMRDNKVILEIGSLQNAAFLR